MKIGANAAGLWPSTMVRSASTTASSILCVTIKMALRGHFVIEPQLEQLAAQRLGGEHVQRGKRLVHEQHFRLDHQRARHAHALFHAAGKLLGIGGFKSIEADGVNDAQGALVPLDGGNRRGPRAAPQRFRGP